MTSQGSNFVITLAWKSLPSLIRRGVFFILSIKWGFVSCALPLHRTCEICAYQLASAAINLHVILLLTECKQKQYEGTLLRQKYGIRKKNRPDKDTFLPDRNLRLSKKGQEKFVQKIHQGDQKQLPCLFVIADNLFMILLTHHSLLLITWENVSRWPTKMRYFWKKKPEEMNVQDNYVLDARGAGRQPSGTQHKDTDCSFLIGSLHTNGCVKVHGLTERLITS